MNPELILLDNFTFMPYSRELFRFKRQKESWILIHIIS